MLGMMRVSRRVVTRIEMLSEAAARINVGAAAAAASRSRRRVKGADWSM